MKLLENYLKSNGFEVFGVKPNKRLWLLNIQRKINLNFLLK